MIIAKASPVVVSPPLMFTDSKLTSLLSYKGYTGVDDTKKSQLNRLITDMIYRGTGQIFVETEFAFLFDNPKAADTVHCPYRLTELLEVKVSDIVIPNEKFYIYEDKIIYKDNSFPAGRQIVNLKGKFGYKNSEGLPPNIEMAAMILIEDLLFGDKVDRMQSNAKSLTLDKLVIDKQESRFGTVTGNDEVDRLLEPFKWEYSPLMLQAKKNVGTILRFTAL